MLQKDDASLVKYLEKRKLLALERNRLYKESEWETYYKGVADGLSEAIKEIREENNNATQR